MKSLKIRLANSFVRAILCMLLTGCQTDIQLNLPEYKPQMVLEFYLEDNKPIKCLLQESIHFTDTIQFRLIDSAIVILSHEGINDTLQNTFYLEPQFRKVYNYFNPKIINLKPNISYSVFVKDRKGRVMTGSTKLINTVQIDSVVCNFSASGKAAAGLVFEDSGIARNFYRIVAFRNTAVIEPDSVWDISFSDILFNGRKFSFYTGYAFNTGDTVSARLYHLTEDHYKFAESVNNAQSSNGNPFGQPANIISGLTGGIGIFSTISYDQKTLLIK